jgi:uridylate kinase
MNKPSSKLAYTRVMLKLSGEALAQPDGSGLCLEALDKVTNDVAELRALGVEVAIVIGGGNFLRGEHFASKEKFDRVSADQMGMMFTVANGIALRSALHSKKVPARLFSPLSVLGVVDPYDRLKAINAIEAGSVAIFAGGTGSPFFSTDSAASLRAVEIKADIVLKASTVDGIYSADPKLDPSAERYERLDYQTIIEKQLKVMDLTAICLCKEHDMPVRVFDMNKPSVIKNILHGEPEGTLVSN